MVIALLIALGVPLIIVFAFAAVVVKRKRWLKKQPGVFAGAIRVASGDGDGSQAKWKRGSGRWVRDILVWSKAPLLLGSQLIPVDGLLAEREAKAGEVKRLGDHAVVVEFATAGGKVEVAAKAEHRDLVIGPLADVSTSAPSTAAHDGQDRNRKAAVSGR
jgi:hypothetical protein